MAEKIVKTSSPDVTSSVFGPFDVNANTIRDAFNVKIVNRPLDNSVGDCIVISGEGEDVQKAYEALLYLTKMAEMKSQISEQTIDYVISVVKDNQTEKLNELDDNCFCVTAKGRPIKAKTLGQQQYIDSIRKNTIVLGVGPAGTGKTFLAVAMAVKALRETQVTRIILTRPAIEAGEKLGFLPGDLQSKIDPYLRPLYDALYEMLGAETYQRLQEKGTIEIAPLAYMRGRTLDDSFIILDEAQNATPEQMKMFLTRLGFNSKAVVTGDLTQTDLPKGQKSGLATVVKILDGIDDIGIHYFNERDVVRHRLVQKIILAYEKYDRELARREAERRAAVQQKLRAEKSDNKNTK